MVAKTKSGTARKKSLKKPGKSPAVNGRRRKNKTKAVAPKVAARKATATHKVAAGRKAAVGRKATATRKASVANPRLDKVQSTVSDVQDRLGSVMGDISKARDVLAGARKKAQTSATTANVNAVRRARTKVASLNARASSAREKLKKAKHSLRAIKAQLILDAGKVALDARLESRRQSEAGIVARALDAAIEKFRAKKLASLQKLSVAKMKAAARTAEKKKRAIQTAFNKAQKKRA